MTYTIDALKEVYVALGGHAEDVTNITLIPDMIHAIADVVTSGASDPEPEPEPIDVA